MCTIGRLAVRNASVSFRRLGMISVVPASPNAPSVRKSRCMSMVISAAEFQCGSRCGSVVMT